MSTVDVIDRYSSLMKSYSVRRLMKLVVQDAHNETLDLSASAIAIAKAAEAEPALLGDPRRDIIGFLNVLWMGGLHSLSLEFWWEMRYRILKLVSISIALEALNLRMILGATKANHRDIPQALIFVKEHIDGLTDESFSGVSTAFDAGCRNQPELCDAYLRNFP